MSQPNFDNFDKECPFKSRLPYLLFVFLFYFCFLKDYINQISYAQPDGSQSNPYPNINTAINQNPNNFSNLTLILVANSSPYYFSQKELRPNLNLTIMYYFF